MAEAIEALAVPNAVVLEVHRLPKAEQPRLGRAVIVIDECLAVRVMGGP